MSYKTLPLFNDLLSAFNMSENELLENFKNTKYERLLEIYSNINDIKLTNEEIIEYIKFIDLTQSNYSDIVKHINYNNFNDIFIDYNNNIKSELIITFCNHIINKNCSSKDKNCSSKDKNCSSKDKHIWLENNFKLLLEYNSKFLKKYLEFSGNYDYYFINEKVLINNIIYDDKLNIFLVDYNINNENDSIEQKISKDLKLCVSDNNINIVKYFINNNKFSKECYILFKNVNNSNYETINFIIDYFKNDKFNLNDINFAKQN